MSEKPTQNFAMVIRVGCAMDCLLLTNLSQTFQGDIPESRHV